MIRQAPTGVAAFIDRFGDGPKDEPVPITSTEAFVEAFGPLDESIPGSLAVAQFFANGGEQAWVEHVDADPGATMLEALVQALDEVGKVEFNLLCVPAVALLDDPTPEANTPHLVGFAQQATQLCTDRRAVLLLDPPQWINDAETMAAWVRANPLADPNAAVWFPRLVDVPSGVESGTSGAIAGLIALTDRERGVWNAPAGLRAKLLGVQTASDLRRPELEELNQLGVNCITNHQGGPVSWGARTMAGRDGHGGPWRYLPVRRLALHIETSILQGLRWRSGEDNDEALWASFRVEVGDFLRELFRAGAMQGTTPRDAYFVRCDSETTSRGDIADGRVRMVVGFAAVRPAEFVVLNLEIRQEEPSTPGTLVSDAVAAALPHLRLHRRRRG